MLNGNSLKKVRQLGMNLGLISVNCQKVVLPVRSKKFLSLLGISMRGEGSVSWKKLFVASNAVCIMNGRFPNHVVFGLFCSSFLRGFHMKKFFSLMVIAAMSISMVGCGDKKKEEPKKDAAPAAPADAKPADAPMGK